MSLGSHAVKFGGEVRHIRDDSDFAVRRPAVQFYSIHDFAQDEPRAITNIGINPSTGLIESNVRNFRFWEFGGYLQDDWEIKSNLTLNPGHPLRVVQPSDGSERPAHRTSASVRARTSSNRYERATVGAVDQVVPGRLQQLRAAPRLLLGSDQQRQARESRRLRHRLRAAVQQLDHETIRFNPPYYSFSVANPVAVALRTRAFRSPTVRSIRTARAATKRSPSPATTATSACRAAWGSSATSSAGTRRSARRSSRCACRIRTRGDAYTHNWFVGASDRS